MNEYRKKKKEKKKKKKKKEKKKNLDHSQKRGERGKNYSE